MILCLAATKHYIANSKGCNTNYLEADIADLLKFSYW